MRHLVKGRKLSRTPAHRKATLNSLSVALIKEHRIVTTEAKAKELRPYVEPIITKAKEDNGHNRRQIFSKLQDKQAVSHLFDEVAQKAKDRPGGYTRVIKIGNRSGDGAKMAVIELVDYNDIKPENTQKKSRTRRAGRSKKSTSSGSGAQTENRTEAEKSEVSDSANKETSANSSSEEE
ncbi:50S ribosomal protein L17 [Fodinibius sp.]|uniref:50S ribosomal protein L17 n=1 Tax=Fodinibius sp. TaxID=1872440 RepID=UPI003568B811